MSLNNARLSMPALTAAPEQHGKVIAVRGSVVDACFPCRLPALSQQLRAGREGLVIVEVSAHLAADRVRGIALTPTQGLARRSGARLRGATDRAGRTGIAGTHGQCIRPDD
jgi:hypothetical protein